MRQKKPIGLNFIVGSGTTYIDGLRLGKPQSFNVISVDRLTMLPLNFETYAFDLDRANKFDDPQWNLVLNYTQEYNLPDMSPQSFYDHSQKIYANNAACVQYRTNRYLGHPAVDPSVPCTFEEKMELYCQTVSNDFDEYQFCQDRDSFDFKHGMALQTIMNWVDHDWFRHKGKYRVIKK